MVNSCSIIGLEIINFLKLFWLSESHITKPFLEYVNFVFCIHVLPYWRAKKFCLWLDFETSEKFLLLSRIFITQLALNHSMKGRNQLETTSQNTSGFRFRYYRRADLLLHFPCRTISFIQIHLSSPDFDCRHLFENDLHGRCTAFGVSAHSRCLWTGTWQRPRQSCQTFHGLHIRP